MFVEGEAVNGMEVFRYRNRGFLLGFILIGMALGAVIYLGIQEGVERGESILFVTLLSMVALVFVVWGVFGMFVVRSLLVDRKSRVIHLPRKTLFSRKTRTLGFDDLRGIRVHRSKARKQSRSYVREWYTATLETSSGKPIKLGDTANRDKVWTIARRISELTGVEIKTTGF